MLITQIKAENFNGIKDPIKVLFTEGGEIEKIGYVNLGKDRISLISGFYGANASGKTTVLNIIDVLYKLMFNRQAEFVVSPLNGIKEETVLLIPNRHNDMQGKSSILGIDFVINSNRFSYLLSVYNNGKEIANEKLVKNGKTIFDRNEGKITFDKKVRTNLGTISQKIVPPKKSSFLSVVLSEDSDVSVFGNIKEVMGISELAQIKNKACFITDKRDIGDLFSPVSDVSDATEQVRNKYLKDINEAIRYFEPSFEKLIIEKMSAHTIKYEAKYRDFYTGLPVFELSSGTRELISFTKPILNILRYGGIVVYDETSKYLHSDMEIAILNLFKNKNINKHNAQIFFASHNHETIDLLHNDQAHIVEKEGNNIVVSKVSDYAVKERDNIKKKYRAGMLGGTPDTIEFERVINNLV